MAFAFRRFYLLTALFLVSVQVPLAGQTAIQSPGQFLPHALGEKFTPHHLLVDYYRYLASAAPHTMRLQRYGTTPEDRPLYIAVFSSPLNMERLEEIRLNHLRMTGLESGTPDLSKPTAIVWISMSVHGNEPSGAEAGMELSWQLATQTDPSIRQWLANTVVIIDLVLNPDGFDHYAHWNRMASNRLLTPAPEAREHREPWPGGRLNHYCFDLNRDWAWATQTETRQRLAVFQQWMPHVHPDVHEQGINEPYYFAPAAEPLHDYITPWQREFQVKIGKNNAQKFDQKGWLYFTKEVFDLFYPSYGDTYPMFNGSIGMTYEQAGGPPAGRAVIIDSGDTLTLKDRIAHHYATCLATIEISSQHAGNLVENFRKYFQQTAGKPQGAYKSYVIKAQNAPNKLARLCQLLDRHRIQYGRAGTNLSDITAFDYQDGKEKKVSLAADDLVISAFQPKSVLTQVLFDPIAHMSDSLTYDITAWALPFAYGLDAFAARQRIDPAQPYLPHKVPEMAIAATPYAWCIRRQSLSDLILIGQLLQKDVKVRYATYPFETEGQKFEAGTFVISRADNRLMGDALHSLLRETAAKNNVSLLPVLSGLMDKGRDFGSESLPLVPPARVAFIYDNQVDPHSYGQIWYFFEQELQYPVTPVALDGLDRAHLYDYSTLILPDGHFALSDQQTKYIQEWVRNGGRLIAIEGGAHCLLDKEGFDLKRKEEPKKDEVGGIIRPHSSRERDNLSDNLPGAIVQAKADVTHPLTYGLGERYHSLKTAADALEMGGKGTPVIYLDDDYASYGFIGYRLKPRLRKTVVAGLQSIGDGEVIYFADNPLFRCFWEQGKVLFTNALFMGE